MSTKSSRPAPAPEGSAATVLLCEGDGDLRQALAALLEGEGLKVVLAGNAREAVSRAISSPPGCIVLSLPLPGADRGEALRGIRGLSGSAGTRVVAIAPPDLPLGEEEGFVRGRDERLPRTFGPRDLLAAIRR